MEAWTDVMTADGARSAHPSAWRERAERAVIVERARLRAHPAIWSVEIVLDGEPDGLSLRVRCALASDVVPLDLMRLLHEELPLRFEAAIGLPVLERHLDLAADRIVDRVASPAVSAA